MAAAPCPGRRNGARVLRPVRWLCIQLSYCTSLQFLLLFRCCAMNLLAVDASSSALSVALYRNGNVRERRIAASAEHAQHLLPLADELLAEESMRLSDLDAVVCGCGPGSFSGLRVAVGMTQGLAFGAGLPVLPVSTLAALAQGAIRCGQLLETELALTALDARMGELYVGLYRVQQGLAVPLQEDCLCRLASPELPAAYRGQSFAAVGEGWRTNAEEGEVFPGCTAVLSDVQPQAQDLLPMAQAALRQGQTVLPQQVSPVYLRGAEAWKKHGERS